MTRARQHWEPDEDGRGFLKAVRDVLYGPELRDFWPVTLRAVHYQMVKVLGVKIGRMRVQRCVGCNAVVSPKDKRCPDCGASTFSTGMEDAFYENNDNSYKRLGGLLTLARLSGKIPWHAIADNHRKMMRNGGGGFESVEDFIAYCTEDFLKGYHTDLLKTQDRVLEVWVEKDTIAEYVNDIARRYGVSTVIARGYGSVSFVHDLRKRVEENVTNGKHTRILYFGDLDPSGVNMLKAMFTTLHDEMDVSEDDIDYVRCAINPEHVRRFNLPPNPDALKDDAWQAKQRAKGLTDKEKGDPRAETYKDEFGKVCVELDALGPGRIQTLVRKAIEDNLDMDAYREAERNQQRDLEKIEDIRERASEILTKAMKSTSKPAKKPAKKPSKKTKPKE